MQCVRERATQISTKLLFFELEWVEIDDERAEELLADRGAGVLPPPPANGAPLPAPPALRARGADRDRDVGQRRRRLEPALRRAHLGDPGRAVERRRGGNAPLDVALARLARPRPRGPPRHRGGRHRGARARARTRAYVFNTLLQDKSIKDRLRSYPHWLAARNLSNEASDESVQALVEAVEAATSSPGAGTGLRRSCSGSTGSPTTTGWPRRRRPTKRSPGSEGTRDRARLLRLLLAASSARWSSASSTSAGSTRRRPGKRGGAFCAYTVPSRPPLRDAQLDRPPPRRAHPRPRARPRPARIPRPRAGHLPPGHAADGGRDRLGLRRDGRLRPPARADADDPATASRCWPRPSRARSPPSSARWP